MSLKGKLALVYILAGFLPVLIILVVNFFQIRNSYRSKEISNFMTYVNQAVIMLDDRMSIYNNISDYISYDYTISDVIGTEYVNNERFYAKFENAVEPLLAAMLVQHEDVKQIKLYIEKDISTKGDFLSPVSEIKNEKWYDTVQSDNKIHWYVDLENGEHKAYLVRKIAALAEMNINGVIYIEVKYNKIMEPFNKKMIDNYGLYITGKAGDVIFEYDAFDEKYEEYKKSFSEILRSYTNEDKKTRVIKKVSSTTGWNIWLYKPEKLMTVNINRTTSVTVIGIVICMIAAFMCIRFTAVFVTKRISKLQTAMALVEKEDFSVTLNSNSTDEIGDLIRSFSKMEKKLNHLINEVYKSKISEKEYEMKALQAQINPHFLYNTLSLINWKAIEAGQKDISKITLALSAFYRTSLNKGSNIISLSGEIENMRSYLSIQLMLHDDDFDVEEDIDESILKYDSLNLILQPLIENAIDHGIDVMPDDRRGKITIKAKDMGHVIELSVIDNGIGMTKEQTSKILTSESKGYGVRNVNDRIKLYYGDQYPLLIKSEINVGTEVIITIPKKSKI